MDASSSAPSRRSVTSVYGPCGPNLPRIPLHTSEKGNREHPAGAKVEFSSNPNQIPIKIAFVSVGVLEFSEIPQHAKNLLCVSDLLSRRCNIPHPGRVTPILGNRMQAYYFCENVLKSMELMEIMSKSHANTNCKHV